MNTERHDAFWKKFPGLVWSNTRASDSVMIMAALDRPRKEQLQAIVREFGLERIRAEWAALQEDGLKSIHREIVDDILAEIVEEMSHAAGRNRPTLADSLTSA